MRNNKGFLKHLKYDILIFLREPMFALPIMILPAFFFILYAGMYAKQGADITTFGQYIPMYVLLISFLTVFFNIGIQLVTDKETGVIKRLTISPINIYNIVFVYVIRGMVISIFGFIEMIAIAKFVYNIPLTENMLAFILCFIIMVGILLLLSLALHGFFKRSRQVVPFTIIAFQYVLFCSGMMFPISQLPSFVKPLVYINPIYYMNKLLTNIWYLKGLTLQYVLPLAATSIVCILILKMQKNFSFDSK